MTYIRNKSDSALFINSGRETVPRIAVGATHRSTFEFTVQQKPEDGTVHVEAEIYDTVTREFLDEDLTLPIFEAPAAPPEVKETKIRVTAHKAPVYIGASDQVPLVAEIEAETILTSSGTLPGWYRVTWEGGGGWIPEQAVERYSGSGRPLAAVTALVPYQAPFVDLQDDIVTTHDATFTLRGVISDDREVRDFYVIVGTQAHNRRPESTKRAYRYLGVATGSVEESIPLSPGINAITLVARDNDKATTSSVLYVFRDE